MPSRQRKWQMRMKAEGRCGLCGAKAVTALHCERHAEMVHGRWNARKYGPGHVRRRAVCGRCGERGHNVRTCARREEVRRCAT